MTACLEKEILDAVVVGAGLSGLTAALELEKRGFNVVVVEALPRVGGRTWKHDVDEIDYVDLGAQWIGNTHENMWALVKEFNLTTYLSRTEMDGIAVHFDGEEMRLGLKMNFWDWTFPHIMKSRPWLEGPACVAKFAMTARRMPDVDFPFELPSGWLEYDNKTLYQWVREVTISEKGALLCEALLRAVQPIGPPMAAEASLLDRLWNEKNSPNLDGMNVPLHAFVRGGAGQIAPLIASKLSNPVLVEHPVVEIQQAGGQATVRTLRGKALKAKNVIVAVPAYLSGRITYDPPLSWKRLQLNQRAPMASVAKIILKYQTHFWEKTGVVAMLSAETGPVSYCMDGTDPDSKGGAGLLVCFAVGNEYDLFASNPDNATRKAAFLTDLAKFYGDEALNPIFFEVGDWPSYPFAQGGYSPYFIPQAWTRFGTALVEPHGLIQWASDFASPNWVGHMEGAVIAGKRAAKNIIEGKSGKLQEAQVADIE
jgi:monoamine oxidase